MIGVDWAYGARKVNYCRATANARVVGSQLAAFILTMQTLGLNLANVHLIGHSLGAQVTGYAGRLLQNPKVGRITGTSIYHRIITY